MRRITSYFIAAMLVLPAPAQVRAEVALRAAVENETLRGDLKTAIEQYKKIATTYAGNRQVVAQALLHLAQCYEKLGDRQARETYERLVRDYADQTETIASARTKLAALTATESAVVATVRHLPFADGLEDGWCVSPDGRYVAFPDGPQDISNLALLDLTTGARRPLTHGASPAQGTEECVFSPDSKRVAFVWSHPEPGDPDELRVINLDGSGERALYRYRSIGLDDWRGDTMVITVDHDSFATQPAKVVFVWAAGGTTRVVKTGGRWQGPAYLSPDGRWLVQTMRTPQRSPLRDVVLVSTADGKEFPIVGEPGDNNAAGWAPDGKSVLFTTDKDVSTDFYALQVEGGEPAAAPLLIRRNMGTVYARLVTARGALYYAKRRNDAMNVYTAAIDPQTGAISAPALATAHNFGKNQLPDWSPEGKLVFQTNAPYVAARGVPADGEKMAFLDPATGVVQEQVLPLFHFSMKRWRPDGKTILLQGQSEPGNQGLFEFDPQTVQVKALARSEKSAGQLSAPQWLPDGRSIVYLAGGAIVQRSLENGAAKELYRNKGLISGNLALSPDGGRLAFLIDANKASGEAPALMVMRMTGGEARSVVRLAGGERFDSPQAIAWTPDGRRILFSKHMPGKRGTSQVSIWSIGADGGEPVNTGLSLDGFSIWAKDPDTLRLSSLSVDRSGRRIAFTVGPAQMDEAWVLEGLPGRN